MSASDKPIPVEGAETVDAATLPPPYSAGGDTLSNPAAAFTKLPAIPGYEVLEVLGRGGMGVVYKARHLKLNRLVALKMILVGGHASAAELERFRVEAEAVARVQHPNIVQIFEVGEHGGCPYLSLEYAEGSSLDRQLDGTPWDPKRAAELVRTLALAMQQAHDKAIVHRDLKPANVLLTADGTPKITDFGLAKKLDEGAGPTQTGAILGTPSYMAPEQIGATSAPRSHGPPWERSHAGQIGPATDVYALGAILYQLITGRPPFKAATPMDTLMQVVADEPVPPSQLQRQTPRDLETICLKCLQKEPGKRYRAAQDLAEDLRRFLVGEPIQARRTGALERVWRWSRRNRLAAGLLASVVAILLIAAVVATIAALQFRAKADALQEQLYVSSIAVAERELTLNQDVVLASELLQKGCPEHLRGWEWHYLMRLRDGARPPLSGHSKGLWMAAFSPDGRRIATASIDGTVKIWDSASGQEQSPAFKGHVFPVMCLAFSPDGRFIATGSLHEVKVWDVETRRVAVTFKNHTGFVYCLAFSPDGAHIASASTNEEKSFAIWETATGKQVRVVRGNASHIHRLRYSPDGKLLLASCTDGSVKCWNVGRIVNPSHAAKAPATFELVRIIEAHPAPVYDLAFSPGGDRFASSGFDGTVRVWETATGLLKLTLRGHTGTAMGVAFSPDGRRIASSGYDKTVRLWDAATGAERLTLRGHQDTVCSVAFSPDGHQLVSASFDKQARIWDASPVKETVGQGLFTLGKESLDGHTDRVNAVAFSSDGRFLASGGWDKTVALWEAQTGKHLRTFKGHEGAVWGVAISRDSQRVASASWDRTVRIWDTETGRGLLTFLGHTTPVTSLAFSPDGQRLVSCSFEGNVKIWDAATGKETTSCEGHLFPAMAAAFSPDRKRVASGSGDRTVKVWDANSGEEVFTLFGHEALVHSVAFSPDGRRIASASWDHTAKVWDAMDGKELLTLRGHTDRVQSVVFSPDGKQLATASEDKTLRVWDTATGKEQIAHRHHGVVWSVSFSPDGKRVASACWSPSGWVKTWHTMEQPRRTSALP